MTHDRRIDYFVVWGHGVPHLHEMVEIIDQNDDVDVLYIKKIEIENLNNFIQNIYAKEWPSVPLSHTLSKTKFLYHVPRQAALILVMNNKPKVRVQNNKNPLFRMPESETIKNIKNLIRKQFDPNKGGKDFVQLVPNYNPDQHVVHASDFPEQIQNALDVFGMRDVAHWHNYWQNKYNTKSDSGSIEEGRNIKEILIDKIRMNILDENGIIYSCEIEKSPHYHFVCGRPDMYKKYWQRFCGTILKENHSLSNFNRLNKEFNYLIKPYESCFIQVKKSGLLYHTVDGDHRLSILKHRGFDRLRVEILDA